MATAAWIEKHILVQHGVPTFKKASKQNQTPKILTLGIKIKDESVKLTLDLGFDEKNPRPVRCLHLASRKAQSDLTELEQGYGHMGQLGTKMTKTWMKSTSQMTAVTIGRMRMISRTKSPMMLLVLKAIDFIHISFPSYPNMAIGTAPMFNKLRYIPHIVLFHSFVK